MVSEKTKPLRLAFHGNHAGPFRLVHGLLQQFLGRVEQVCQLVILILGNRPGPSGDRAANCLSST
jgi:hypothetical protein